MKLKLAIQYMGAETPGIDPALMARDVASFVIDSREIQAGDVFFALSQPEYKNNGFNGDFDDATVYVKSSLENGAVAAVRLNRLPLNAIPSGKNSACSRCL